MKHRTMQRACFWIVRNFMLLTVLWSNHADSQQTPHHRKAPHRTGPPQEFRSEHRETHGAWGTWGSWSTCSRTCGKGVQEQTRSCLPMYTSARYPTKEAGLEPQQPVGVISALRPSVPLLRDTVRTSNSSSRGDAWRTRSKETRPGERRRVVHTPGRYGYGRAPYVAPLQTDTEIPLPHRQKRSAADNSHHPSPRGHDSHRSNNLDSSNNHHLYNRPYSQQQTQQSRNSQVWAPLYQPGSVQQEIQSGRPTPGFLHHDRPYNPLPSSFCTEQPTRHRICNSNDCPSSSQSVRAVQCSSYNHQPFMGRLYEWEPFTEGTQNCELNCRAIGFKFYVQQAKQVMDGTPCGQNHLSLCVAGKCVVGPLNTHLAFSKKRRHPGHGLAEEV